MILAARDLAIGHRGAEVGRGLTLSLGAGEVLCLLGPNGCGKTTLFRTLLGLLPPLGGTLALDGRPLAAVPRAERARRLGYVPQAAGGGFPFTALEVTLMGRASRIGRFAAPSAADHAAARAALESLGVARLAPRPFPELSGGERQMVLIARALAQEPALIVMDEPTASLDFGNAARVLGCIRGLAERGLAVLISTHEPDHAFACADRAALMQAGSILAEGPPAEVLTAERLGALYGVAVAVAYVPEAGRRLCAPRLEGAGALA